jgi:hypothetical protein
MGLDISEFQNFGAAKASQKGEFFREGHGVAVVDELIYKRMNGGLTFVARCKIVESANKGDVDEKGQPIQPNAAGSGASWVQVYKPNVGMEGRVKAFLLALVDESEATVDATPGAFAKMMQTLTQDEGQPAKGMLICYSSFTTTTKAGKKITAIAWTPAKGANAPEKIKARREKLLSGGTITVADA